MPNSNTKNFRETLFDFPFDNFLKHLQQHENDRILFSGKFGIGKTFFLDHFFKNETQIQKLAKAKFNAFHLFPINYSIASNEDIFRYLKYDIITCMLIKEIEIKDIDYSYIDSIPSYLRGNMLKVFATLVFMIPKIGKDVYESYKKLIELKKGFEAHDKKARNAEGDKFIEFMENIEEKEGSIFENNVITKLISTVLNRLKDETEKENILIIDDLDRIDPEHLFRLLNVFAAHLDESNSVKNKLGFDKVIIVCDINNLRNIFKAKYGIQTDFNGYIDKFYSADIYHFDNREILYNVSFEAFKNIKLSNPPQREELYYESQYFRKPNLPMFLLELLISNGFVSLRTLLNRINNKIEFKSDYYLKFDEKNSISQVSTPLFVHFKILKEIVGGYEILKEYLMRIPTLGHSIPNLNSFCNELLYYVFFKKTLGNSGNIHLLLDNRRVTLKIPENYKRVFEGLLVSEPDPENLLTPTQLDFTFKEFQILLFEFIDILKRVEN